MKTFEGTVENGTVRLPEGAHVRNGARVVVTVVTQARKRRTLAGYPRELEAEDARFVLACRGRLARELHGGEV